MPPDLFRPVAAPSRIFWPATMEVSDRKPTRGRTNLRSPTFQREANSVAVLQAVSSRLITTLHKFAAATWPWQAIGSPDGDAPWQAIGSASSTCTSSVAALMRLCTQAAEPALECIEPFHWASLAALASLMCAEMRASNEAALSSPFCVPCARACLYRFQSTLTTCSLAPTAQPPLQGLARVTVDGIAGPPAISCQNAQAASIDASTSSIRLPQVPSTHSAPSSGFGCDHRNASDAAGPVSITTDTGRCCVPAIGSRPHAREPCTSGGGSNAPSVVVRQ